MGEFVQHEPCPACGSRDNLARYDDGSAYCFGCSAYEGPGGGEGITKPEVAKRDLLAGRHQSLTKRGISEETCRKFSYVVGSTDKGPFQAATFFNKNCRPVAQKVRHPDKSFRWVGDPTEAGLFGQQLWKSGRRVVVTEGEIDALSVAEIQERRWPVVSVRNGAGGAVKDFQQELEWLEGFEEVVIMFDMDDPGREAAELCAALLSPGKAKIAQLPLKDANEMLLHGRGREVVQATFDARTWAPGGIVKGEDLWELVDHEPALGLTYPWASFQDKLYGMRPQELVVWTAGTGIGKSSFVREVAYHLATHHKETVGVVALEESVRKAALCQLAIHLSQRIELPNVWVGVSADDRRSAFDHTLGTGRYFFYDHFGSVTAESLLPKLRYLVKGCGVRWLVIDHISILVSGMAAEGDERKRIDQLMTQLRSFVQETGVGMHLVSHLRKADGKPFEEGGQISLVDLRGSGSIAQLADIVLGVERNQQSDVSDQSIIRVLKNRFSGECGPLTKLRWDRQTGRIIELSDATHQGGDSDYEGF